jgi:hypothetical protein
MKAVFNVVLPVASLLLIIATLVMQLMEMKFYEMF